MKRSTTFALLFVLAVFTSPLFAETPTANLLGPEAFVRSKGGPIVEEIVFEVSIAGSANLMIRNGATDGGMTGERVSSSIILLNGLPVVTPNSFNQKVDHIQVPVNLVAGENTLSVELRSKPGSCIIITISAPVDSIDLESFAAPIKLGVDPLVCNATVSALGMPASSIDVTFTVDGFPEISPVTAQTDATGHASVSLSGFLSQGLGTATATVVGSVPTLQDSEDFEVEQLQEVTLDQGLSSMVVEVGTSQYIAYTVTVIGVGGQLTNVTFDQSVSPNSGGISLTSDYPGGWWTLTDKTWVINEYITGHIPGVYEVTSSAGIAGSGSAVTKKLTVYVIDPGEAVPLLWVLGCEPSAIRPNLPTDVTFSVLMTGLSLPIPVRLVQLDELGNETLVGVLNDNGADGDIAAGDNIYSGTAKLLSGEPGKLRFQAKAHKDGNLYRSGECLVSVTELPIGPAASDPSKLVEDPGAETKLYSNEVVVGFFPQITESRILEIVGAEGGTIIGTIPALGVCQIRILGDGTSAGVQAAIAAFNAYPEVEYAEGNYAAELDEFVPNDSKYGDQSNMTTIRADEAWVVAKGSSSITIAVIDTGVDYDHEDLTGKVIKGKNYADDNDDPDDTLGHGTHVAGIAAAHSNNTRGVAGVAWDSKILAIRWTDGTNGSAASLAASIRYAADNSAKIINISGGTSNARALRKAIDYADGKGLLICASAGNSGIQKKRYPGSYEACFCVGNTTDSDARSASSSYGVWVDIAAPGEGVWSTIPDNKYGKKSGTSMSTPLMAGAAAVVWSQHPSWTAAQVRERLEKSSKPLDSSLKIGVGRIDLFEAVFNGSFEIGDLSEWSRTGTCSTLQGLGAIEPQHGERMGYASTGPAGDEQAATLEKTFTIQPGVTSFLIKFEYNFVTEEYPEWVGTIFNDALEIVLTAPNGTKTVLASEDINGSSFTMYTGYPPIDFPGGDHTVGQTGWKTASSTIPVTQGAGKYTIEVKDAGDDIYDSVILIDHIRLK